MAQGIDVPNLTSGRIVKLRDPRPDPQGQNLKIGRQYVVTNSPASIARGDGLQLVAISGTIKGTADEVPLKHGNPGIHCFTRLTKRSVAVCSWVEEAVGQSEVTVGQGFVDPSTLERIRLTVAAIRKPS
jgi:hypothetical protein